MVVPSVSGGDVSITMVLRSTVLRTDVSMIIVSGDVVLGYVVLVSAVSRVIVSGDVVFGGISRWCLLCRGLLWRDL